MGRPTKLTAKQRIDLAEQVRRGVSLRLLRRSWHVTERRIKAIYEAESGRAYSERSVRFTLADIDRLLGTRDKQAEHWQAVGALSALHSGYRTPRSVDRDELERFLADWRYWPDWRPERITDEHIREWAIEMRAEAGETLTTTQVAERYVVSRDTVKQWCQEGRIPATAVSQSLKRHRWVIRAADLTGWVPPSSTSKAGYTRRRWQPSEHIIIGRLRAAGALHREIGLVLDVPMHLVRDCYRRLNDYPPIRPAGFDPAWLLPPAEVRRRRLARIRAQRRSGTGRFHERLMLPPEYYAGQSVGGKVDARRPLITGRAVVEVLFADELREARAIVTRSQGKDTGDERRHDYERAS